MVADSESSSIRFVHFTGKTTTLIGGVSDLDDLFAFGDVDGQGSFARLQHPVACCYLSIASSESLSNFDMVIADTYNHKLKLANRKSGDVREWPLTAADGTLSEPSGLAFDPDEMILFVTDTNNNILRSVDLRTSEMRRVKFLESRAQELDKKPTPC